MKYKELRKKYPRFIYEKYSYKISGNNLETFFNFKVEPSAIDLRARPDIYFRPRVIIENIDKSRIKKGGDRVLNNLIFHLGLMEVPSYWKATCSPEIIIKAGPLNKKQIKWWKDLIINGMGQFFYENRIDFRKPNFLNISSINVAGFRSAINVAGFRRDGVLVPVGGGKDSAVTLEILKRVKKNINCFSLNPTGAAQKIMKIAGCKNPIIVKRKIDKKLLELNRQGFLNGHTPFSAYLAFLSILVATIFNYKYITFSNERSSNEGNVKYLGKIINHQWSKSFDFEKKFRNYSKKYLAKNLPAGRQGIEYFSFLRPLYEIQIAKLFSKYPKYFSAFLSCNEAHKTASGTKKPTKKWCCNCSKCLFVWTCLYPFVVKKELVKIFGENLFDKKKLLSTMQELIGGRKFKPFECIGTKKESLIAFYLSWKKGRSELPKETPFLLKYFQNKIIPKYPNLEKESKKIMKAWNNQHNLPREFEKNLKKVVS